MYLGFNNKELIVTFDENDYEGKTVLFEGEQLEDGSFLACPLFVHKIYPTTIEEKGRGIQDEIVGEELTAMMQAISAYCEKTSQKVVFEEITPVPYVPSKVKVLYWSNSQGVVLFEEGLFAGQAVRWSGEYIAEGFWFYSFAAEIIRPPSEGKEKGYAYANRIEVIRNVEKREYPALRQAMEEVCAARGDKAVF